MKSQTSCLKAFVHESEHVTAATAAFQHVKEAFEYVDAHRGFGGVSSQVIRDRDGHIITGHTSHGEAILDILKRKDRSQP